MVSPGFLGIIAVAGAVGAVATTVAVQVAKKVGPELKAVDLLPAAPPRLPLPRFFYEKPELLNDLKRR